MNRLLVTTLLSLALATPLFAQSISVRDTLYPTYGFSDPDPIPALDGNIYPYYKFAHFDKTSSQRQWKEIILENEWLRVRIMPEIGGKIWSIYDKVSGKEVFYDNDAVKFRDISLRGPWTSGGIEFNYGVIGHGPSCAEPVEWKTVEKEDGSVSCYIGVLDLLTRSTWTVEINLPKDEARVRTRSFWHNHSGEFQPYYTWANSGIKASEDLELIYPAAYSIGHDGLATAYPIDAQGHDLSLYAQQNFGVDKSFHPAGSHKGFFGAMWKDSGNGVLHYALRDEKLGRKYFSWAQSEQGEIWVGLLTDKSGQYVELQSGRLFNQNLLESIQSPFKQTLFSPYGTDTWSEWWLPFSGIDEVDEVGPTAVVSVREGKIGLYPLKQIEGELLVEGKDGEVLYKDICKLDVAEVYTFLVSGNPQRLSVNGEELWNADSQTLTRPHETNPDFDLNSEEGLAIWGEYLYGMRYYKEAEQKADASLALNPSLVRALNLKAMLCFRDMRYALAKEYSDRVLAIDAYDPTANYIGGLACKRLSLKYDALDRFEICAITNPLRSAACTQLAMLYFADGQKALAAEYAGKSLQGNADNITAYKLLYQVNPDSGILREIEKRDPLCPFPQIERMLAGEISAKELSESIREELAWQVYLENAVFYSELGLKDKASRLLSACPQQNALLLSWQGWLRGDESLLSKVDEASVELVFPFRPESYAPLQWAADKSAGWKADYLLACLKAWFGDRDGAEELLSSKNPSYAPWYALRYNLHGDRQDLRKALDLEPGQWRYRQMLSMDLYNSGEYKEARAVLEPYYKRNKDNFHIGETLLRVLIAQQDWKQADKVISQIEVLPFEGQGSMHRMWRNIKLHLAAASIDGGKYAKAAEYVQQSRSWPERLGVGRPYDNLVDEDMENLFSAVIAYREGKNDETAGFLAKIGDPCVASVFEKAKNRSCKVSPLLDNDATPLDKRLF